MLSGSDIVYTVGMAYGDLRKSLSKLFSWILISKMGVKMNLSIETKNHSADSGKGFLTKSISKLYGRATAMPPAWELIKFIEKYRLFFLILLN